MKNLAAIFSNESFIKKLATIAFVFINLATISQELPSNIFVSIKAQESTISKILNDISEQTGYFFVYDNQVIDDEKIVNVRESRLELFSFLKDLLPDKSISFRVIDRHILILKDKRELPTNLVPIDYEMSDTTWHSVSGYIFDISSREPLPFASIGFESLGLGISSNLEGFFRLRFPAGIEDTVLSINYLGYEPKKLPLDLIRNKTIDIFLEPQAIELAEVVIRDYDALATVMKMIENKSVNFSDRPVYHYNFYREGVSRNDKLLNYSEAIFKIFKEPIHQRRRDQVKVLRGRNVENADITDTLVLKLKAGVQSTLELDIMKVPPDFLQEEFMPEFVFTNAGFSTREGRSAYAIAFEQRKDITKPFFKGILYIDTEDYALIEAEFEVNPRFIADAGGLFFIGWRREFIPTMKRAKYNVRYKKNQGFYHVHHIRGELELSVGTRRGRDFSTYSAFFETVVVKIDDYGVRRFPRSEVIRPNVIFVDQDFDQDDKFWSEFSVITPETSVIDAFAGIRTKIESFLEE